MRLGIVLVLCCTLFFTKTVANHGENIYQKLRTDLQNVLENTRSSYASTFSHNDVDKLSEILNMEKLLNHLDTIDDEDDDSFDIPKDQTTDHDLTSIQNENSNNGLSTTIVIDKTTVEIQSTAGHELHTSQHSASETTDLKTTARNYNRSTKESNTLSSNSMFTTRRQTTNNEYTTEYHQSTDTIATTQSPLKFSVSPLCLNHTKAILAGLFGRKQWALQMIDSAGKPAAGLMTKHVNWRGDYDECVGVKAVSNISEPPYEFNGKYCTITVGSKPVVINPLSGKPAGKDIGFCLPESCSDDDTKDLLGSVISRVSNKTYFVISASCAETLQSYDTRAKIVLAVIGCFIAIMTIATAYDVLMIQMSKSRSKQTAEIYQNGGPVNNGTILSKTNGGFESDDHNSSDKKYKLSGGIYPELPNYEDKLDTREPYKPGTLGKLLLSFSVYTNGAKILSTHQGAGSLTAVNGIRFISMTWVILGHTYAFGIPNASNIATLYPKLISRRSFMAIINAEVSVDTFFALSGCLLTYLVLKQMKNQKGKLNWFMFYFHRFWRLTPPYMLVMMVYLALFPYIGSGPVWPKNGVEKNYCEKTWWYNLLYIQNFINITDQCFIWAWYLANDMQFYVISPIIIVPLFFSKIGGTIVTGVFLLGTSIASGVISTHFNLGVSTFSLNVEDYFEQYYIRPYTRMGPYLVGMYTGYLLYKTNCKCKINKFLNIVLWGFFIAVALTVLYGVYEDFQGNHFTTEVAALYNTLHKTAWGAALCWVIFACATGNGGFVNTLLSWKCFVPLSRLTYCAYLIHPPVIYYYVYTRKQQVYWDDHQVIYDFLGNLGISYAVAFVTTLAFESPMMGLEKVIFRKGDKK